MKRLVLYILSVLTATGCIYPFHADIPDDGSNCIVVAGDILIGEPTVINLGYVLSLDMPALKLRDYYPYCDVYVENDKGGKYKAQRQAGGVYIADTSNAPEDAKYRLCISYKNKGIEHEYMTPWAGVNQAPGIADLSYDVLDDKVRLNFSLDGLDTLNYFKCDYTETWEYNAYYRPELMYDPSKNGKRLYRHPYEDEDFYYCWDTKESLEPVLSTADGLTDNTIQKKGFLTIPRDDYRLSVLYSIQVTARGLSHDAYSYMYNQSALSNGTGDLFQPVPSEMRGNVLSVNDPNELTVGYVSVCKVSRRRMFIKSSGIYYSNFDPFTLLFYPPDEDGKIDFERFFQTDSPVMVFDTTSNTPTTVEPTMTNVLWGPKRCTDCRAWGGTKTKPEWWPNNHK